MIIQGSNDPIVIEFDDDLSAVTKASFKLVSLNGKELKTWSLSDIDILAQKYSLPLTEAETLAFPAGIATLSVKLMTDTKRIIFFDEMKILVQERINKVALS